MALSSAKVKMKKKRMYRIVYKPLKSVQPMNTFSILYVRKKAAKDSFLAEMRTGKEERYA